MTLRNETLITLCNRYGLNVVASKNPKKILKIDYERVLCGYFLNKEFGDKIPKAFKLVSQLDSHMLCSSFESLKSGQQDEIWESPDIFIEPKYSGLRMFLVYVDGEFHLFSREKSDVNFRRIDFISKVMFPKIDIDLSFILDVECISTDINIAGALNRTNLVITDSAQAVNYLMYSLPDDSLKVQSKLNNPLRFIGLTCLYLNGEWFLDKDELIRKEIMNEVLNKFQGYNLPVISVATCFENKKEYFNKMIKLHYEGVVAKFKNSKYLADANRSKYGWIKVKKSHFNEMIMDTVDAFISGYDISFEPICGQVLVSSLEFSIIIRKNNSETYTHSIVNVPIEIIEDRKNLTENNVLASSYLGKVCELTCLGANQYIGKFNSGVICQYRFDKTFKDCIIDEFDFLTMLSNMHDSSLIS